MNTKIDYNKFISQNPILHSNTATNFMEGIMFFVQNKSNYNIITYIHRDKFSLNHLQIDNDFNYYFEYTPERLCDIMDNIIIKPHDENIVVSYYIGANKYDPMVCKEFVFVSALCNKFKIRFTFIEKPDPAKNYEFVICSRNYILDETYRKYLRGKILITNSMVYDGCGVRS